jgi:hypothetical protein
MRKWIFSLLLTGGLVGLLSPAHYPKKKADVPKSQTTGKSVTK